MKRTILDLEDIEGKRIFLRVDLNVPFDAKGEISDETKIKSALPTIKYLLSKSAKIVLCSHLGRPNGKKDESLSLVPVAKLLMKYLPLTTIKFSYDCIGEKVVKKTNELRNGEILFLENIRFYPEEEKNDPLFSKKLAELADIYVDDAFGTAHRVHASIVGVAKLLPNAMGLLMGKEVNSILKILYNAERPFVAVLGGSKVADKIYIVLNLLKKADTILIGGGMAYTFLVAGGHNVGNSLIEEEKIDLAREILEEAEKQGVEIVLPVDHKCATEFVSIARSIYVGEENIPEHLIGMDIGPKTIKLFTNKIKQAKTVIWNGPLGVFEFNNFSEGTTKIAKAVAKVNGTTVVGGGDSIASIRLLGLDKKIGHLSTGGGATLNLLEGAILPGVEVIENVKQEERQKI